MSRSVLMAVVLALGFVSHTLGQSPAGTAASAPDPDMQRAMRDAFNPMRRILEAAQVARAKVGERRRVVTPAQGSTDSPPRPSTAGAAPTPEPVTVPDTGIRVTVVPIAPATPASTVEPAPGTLATTAPAPQATPAATPPPVVARPVSSAPDPMSTNAMKSTLPEADSRSTPAGAGVGLAVPDAKFPRPPAEPVLLSMVEPVLTPQMMDRLPTGQVLDVRLVIQPDGTVSQVELLPPASAQLARPIRAALLQWKYDSAPTERQLSVQLVFR